MNVLATKFSAIDHLKCSGCNMTHDADTINTYAQCDQCTGNPFVSVYSLPACERGEGIDTNISSMWRYGRFLPIANPDNIVTLGEGWTPIISLPRTASELDLAGLVMKDEGLNPTGSFKARGLSAAISKLKELGVERCIIPTAGNAGIATAAYAARAGIHATVIMPSHTPMPFQKECALYGAELILVDGFINDCALEAKRINAGQEYFDLSTMREPFRLEGKKTLGYEMAEQLNYELPDCILYPTGGGTGLLGIWKAFQEMEMMGWLQKPFPRMIAVQAENCRPVVRELFDEPDFLPRPTIASGLAVPKPFAQKMILEVIRASRGTAVAVSDDEIRKSMFELARTDGAAISPEGASLLAALKCLLANGGIKHSERVLFLNTGNPGKYIDSL